MESSDIKYLQILSRQYPTVAVASEEIINLNAIMALPKGTEHFITDVHGEYEQFKHVLHNGSGAIRRKIEEEFGHSFREEEKRQIAALIYYPKMKLDLVAKEETNIDEWYAVTIHRLIRVCRNAATKYTRSKVRKSLPAEFAYIIEELMTSRLDEDAQEAYYNEIINSVIQTKRARELIIAICNLIRRLVVDHLHVVGDIFDRGPSPHLVMDTLINHHSVDIQWGNHDVIWMGAAAGSAACMANVIRIAARYGNLSILEDGYGINLVPLAKFALSTYSDDPCSRFKIDYVEGDQDADDALMEEKMHKAIAIIQFKLEGQLYDKYPWFEMDNRKLLHLIDIEKGIITIEGKEYPLRDHRFPTVDWSNPYALSPEESDVVDRLVAAFTGCEKLQNHVRFLYTKGSMYKVYNGNLLYHGCVPMNADGTFKEVTIFDEKYKGKALYDKLESLARKGYYSVDPVEKEKGQDILLYIWENQNSPVFGKEKMTTFERYFVDDEAIQVEPKNAYYSLVDNEKVVNSILREFNLDPETAHIINGHIPVVAKKGESPVKCGGKLLIIDGGFSKAYQRTTGIAGYTLVYNSYGLMIAAHEPFTSVEKVVREGTDIHSNEMLIQHINKRLLVADTDAGQEMRERVEDLTLLLDAYRSGLIKETR